MRCIDTAEQSEVFPCCLNIKADIFHRIAVVVVDCLEFVHRFLGGKTGKFEAFNTYNLRFELFGTLFECMQVCLQLLDGIVVLHNLQCHTL